jgi:hypothetical protein
MYVSSAGSYATIAMPFYFLFAGLVLVEQGECCNAALTGSS